MIEYGPTLLKIDHISLSYGDKLILRDICQEIREVKRDGGKGQIVGLLGPSGIGKTQLFRIIAGLNRPTSGEVYLDGGKPVHPGLVGVVSQNYVLFWHRTVLSNLMLAATRKDHKTARDRVQGLLDEFGLADKANLYPAQLSGGQRQRIAIIQQVLCSEHYLILDEPFSGLDLVALEKTVAMLQRVANLDEANTLLIVSHDVTTICSASDHVWMLGREHGADGNFVPGSRIVKVYDLASEGLCWHPEIITQPSFVDFVRGVKEEFRNL